MSTANRNGKVCVICGADLAGKPRTKDKNGRYFCTSCYEAAIAAKHAKRAGATMPKATPTGRARTLSDSAGEPLDIELDDVKPVSKTSSRAPTPSRAPIKPLTPEDSDAPLPLV